MKDKRCFICKYQGHTNEETCKNEIFGKQAGNSLTILLCYSHSVQLFKLGQTNFMLIYRPNFSDYYGGHEEDSVAISYF
jgi:hypothetical protein